MKPSENSNLVIISGPSGVGKGTVISALIARNPNVSVAISATTRAPRQGEVSGKQYYFMNAPEFIELANTGGFIEWCEVHGNFYGTLKSEVNRLHSDGKIVILEIDIQGAQKIKDANIPCMFIFIDPPSMAELETRLKSRGTEDAESVALRISGAHAELAAGVHYDHRVVNSTIESAVQHIESILFLQEVPK